MTQDIIISHSHPPSLLGQAAQVADQLAADQVLEEYREGKAPATLARQQDDVACFEAFLLESGVSIQGMYDDLSLWAEMSDGLVKGFLRWLRQKGFSIGTINVRLSTIRTYCRLSMSARYLPAERYQLIKAVEKISEKEGRNIDEKRDVSRVGTKKAEPTAISPPHVALLKQKLRGLAAAGDSYSASNLLLLCLLADHGLRCIELSELAVEHVQLVNGLVRFYRRKVHKWQNIQLTADTLDAFQCYFRLEHPVTWLFPGERGALARRSINWRVGEIGKLVEINCLSPHDLRHYWATYAQGDIGDVQQAGGWKTPFMLLKYRLDNEIANEGVVVPGQEGWREKRGR
jgi:integrase